jgi:hypothetical protein
LRVIEPRHSTLRRLCQYWLEKKAERLAPPRQDIDLSHLGDLLPHVFLLEVEYRPLRFRFRLVGAEIVERFGGDVTGRYIDEIEFSYRAPSVAAYYAAVVTTREPSCHNVHYTTGSGRHLVYERVILPLSSDGETVDMLLGGIRFDEAYETTGPSAARGIDAP